MWLIFVFFLFHQRISDRHFLAINLKSHELLNISNRGAVCLLFVVQMFKITFSPKEIFEKF